MWDGGVVVRQELLALLPLESNCTQLPSEPSRWCPVQGRARRVVCMALRWVAELAAPTPWDVSIGGAGIGADPIHRVSAARSAIYGWRQLGRPHVALYDWVRR